MDDIFDMTSTVYLTTQESDRFLNETPIYYQDKISLCKCIVAGSRSINDYDLVVNIIKESNFQIDEIICGEAKGVDNLGKLYGEQHNIPIKSFPAKWSDLTVTPCIIRYGKWKNKFNAAAGYIRNEEMAKYSSHLILIWDGISKGSKSMLELAKKYNLVIYEKIIK